MWRYILIMLLFCTWYACQDPMVGSSGGEVRNLEGIQYAPTPLVVEYPSTYPRMEIPPDNPMTEEGVLLGRHLFYDPILSLDSTMSCSSCHMPEGSFTDNLAVSVGVEGIAGTRSSMSLLDVAFYFNGLFWDGRVNTLEEQALLPVEDSIELHHTWPEVIDRFKRHRNYDTLFRQAFGIVDTDGITKELAAKAIAQFERTIVSSGKSKYDRIIAGLDVYSEEELDGRNMFFDEDINLPDAQCFHCHNAPLFTDNLYTNNGINAANDWIDFPDPGRYLATNETFDRGKFRNPSLRNVLNSAPYMHDGRFKDIDEVMDHYLSGGHPSIGKDPNVDSIRLNTDQRAAVIAFLRTLSDEEFMNNPDLQSPF